MSNRKVNVNPEFRKIVRRLIAELLERKSFSAEDSLDEKEYLQINLKRVILQNADAVAFISGKSDEEIDLILQFVIAQAIRKRRLARRYYITGC